MLRPNVWAAADVDHNHWTRLWLWPNAFWDIVCVAVSFFNQQRGAEFRVRFYTRLSLTSDKETAEENVR